MKNNLFIYGEEHIQNHLWRFGIEKIFQKKVMRHNYRSCQQIQNYSNLLCKETRSLYRDIEDLSSVIIVCTTEDNWGI